MCRGRIPVALPPLGNWLVSRVHRNPVRVQRFPLPTGNTSLSEFLTLLAGQETSSPATPPQYRPPTNDAQKVMFPPLEGCPRTVVRLDLWAVGEVAAI